MFNTQSDYALNKLDKEAIVCPSATGVHIRLTREDFASEEEFLYWKELSDSDYHKRELAGWNDSRSLSLETQRDCPLMSAEDIVFAPYLAAEQAEQRRRLLEQVRRCLCLYYLEGKTEAEIAVVEGISQQCVSRSLIAGAKIVEKFFS